MALHLKTYVAATLVFLAMDFIWLGILMADFYKRHLGALARRSGDALNPIWWSAGVVYLLIPAAIVLFVLPKVSSGSYAVAVAWGALFGVVLYGVYDFTNYATLEGWTLKLAVTDTVWGGVICGVTSAVALFAWRLR